VLGKDLQDTSKQLAADMPFTKKVNQWKQNLVTTGQTPGCLCFHRNANNQSWSYSTIKAPTT